MNLIHVIVSLTSLNEELRRLMEPRTASAQRRLSVIQQLSQMGIPVGVNTAPIIPGLNDHEIPELIKQASLNGACWAGYTVVRLNGSVGEIFSEWIHKSIPNKAEKVLNQIKEMHGGRINDSDFGRRMTGEAIFAEHIKQLHKLSKTKYMAGRSFPPYNYDLFIKGGQLRFF